MNYLSVEVLIEKIVKAVPNPKAITNWKLIPEQDAVKFDYEGIRYRVCGWTDGNFLTEEVQGDILVSSGNARRIDKCLEAQSK